jgi:hypothetical protein
MSKSIGAVPRIRPPAPLVLPQIEELTALLPALLDRAFKGEL